MMGTILVGCSGALAPTTEEASTTQVERSTSSSEESTVESSSEAGEKADETSEHANSSQISETSVSSTSVSSNSTEPAPRESASSESSQARAETPPSRANKIPNTKESTAGDQRVWGSRRTKRYYTPAQNYRGFRPRNAVPFENEAAAQAAGYTQASRQPR